MRGLLLAAAGLLLGNRAEAADSTGSAAPASVSPSAAPADTRPVSVVLHTESNEVTLESVRQAVSDELGIAAVTGNSKESFGSRGVLTITYRPATQELAITYSDAARGTVTRVLPAPEHATDVPGLAALVAGNLVRDQAAELLPPPAPKLAPESAPEPRETALIAPAAASGLRPPAPTPPVEWLGNAALFFPLASNMNHPEVYTHFDLNLLYGRIGRLSGLEVGMLSTVSGDAQGLQASLLGNLVGGQVRAGQFSFVFNRGRSLEGMQVAFVNRADEAMQGLQLGAINSAGSPSTGLQVSALNIAGDFTGLQLGLLNIGRKVKGVQLGLVNIADDVDGVPIGLVSVSRAGGVHPVAWTSNTTYGNIGIKFATRYTYTMLSGAVHSDGERGLYGGGFLIGGTIPVAKHIATDIDVGALHLFANTPCCRDRFTGAIPRAHDETLGKVRASLRFELLRHFSLFAGAGVTGKVTYPLRGGDTEVRFTLLPELFGGVQL